MARRCYHRFVGPAYLHTCLEPAGHGDEHHDPDDTSVRWTTDQGFWDRYGDQPHLARKPEPVEETTDAEAKTA